MTFETYLQNHVKANGDKLTPATIERYVGMIKPYDQELKKIGKNYKLLANYMNLELKKRPSIVLRSAFFQYLVYKDLTKHLANSMLNHTEKRASSLTSIRFLQEKVLSMSELILLMEEIKDLRTKFIISFFYDTACRIDEFLKLKVMNLEKGNPDDIKKNIYYKIVVIGKGQKRRVVYIGKKTAKLLFQYKKLYNLKDSDKLIEFKMPNNEIYKKQDDQLRIILKKIGNKILGKNLHPHMFRHTKATHLADAGADILDIMAYLGHSKISTTEIYIKISTYRGQRSYIKYSRDIGE